MATLEGHCLCGKVSYESSSEPLATLICHCKNCQRQAGAAFSINVVVPADSITTKGTLKTFRDSADSGNTVDREFCPECGSPIFSKPSASTGITVIKAGTLDDTSGLTPGLQLWCDSAQNWVELDGKLTSFPGNMPG